MAFENLSEQIKESLISLKARITESESFNRLSEAYQNLPPRDQKLITIAGAVIGAAILINIPLQSFLVSQEELTKYNEQKQVVQRLNMVEQLKNQNDFQPERFEMSRLERDLLERMKAFQVVDEQFRISPSSAKAMGVPPKAVSSGFTIFLTNLNVRQISRVASLLENYSDSILLTGFRSKASAENDHYFNTEFEILNFSAPEDEGAATPGRPSFRGR